MKPCSRRRHRTVICISLDTMFVVVLGFGGAFLSWLTSPLRVMQDDLQLWIALESSVQV